MSVVPQGGLEAAANAGGRRWSFATAEFDERSFELHVNGQLAELERKSLEVLRQLLYRAGEVVTKDELLEAVWPGRILSDNSLPKSISRIREVLGDDEQLVIKTVHGYGYRLVAPVKVQSSRAAPALTRLDLKAGDHPPLRPLWSLVERLGTGGQGEVWLVRHDKTREQRVFKFALDVAGLAAIKREITLYRFLRESLEGRDEFTRVLDWNLEEAPYYIELAHGVGGNLESWAESVGGLDQVPLVTRMELVAQIAEALAAAHSVGVLHKDLKPSNVLVISSPLPREAGERSRAERAGEGQLRIKLTDFGSGGVLDPQRLEALGITRLGFTQSIMQGEAAATAMYLAPEVMTGQPATVQADVYSLGILLYQMAVGDLKQPLAPGWELRIGDSLLCEDIALAVAGDPTKRLSDAAALATRLRTLDERRRQRAAEAAEKLRLEQEQQAATERARRAELAVERLRTRRQWTLTVLAILIVAVSISLGLYLEARRARNEATVAATTSQAVADFLSKDLLGAIDLSKRPTKSLTVKEMLDAGAAQIDQRFAGAPDIAAKLHAALGESYLALEFPETEKEFERALALLESRGEAGSAATLRIATQLLNMRRTPREWSAVATRARALLEEGIRRNGPRHESVIELRQQLAFTDYYLGEWSEAATALKALLDDLEGAPAPDPKRAGAVQSALGAIRLQLGNFEEAEAYSRRAIALIESTNPEDGLATTASRTTLAETLGQLGRYEEADRELTTAYDSAVRWVPRDSAYMLGIRIRQGELRTEQGRLREAAGILEAVLQDLSRSEHNEYDTEAPAILLSLADAYLREGKLDAAEAQLRSALRLGETANGPAHPLTERIRIRLAEVLRTRGDAASAAQLLHGIDGRLQPGLVPGARIAADLRRVQGLVFADLGEVERAKTAFKESVRIHESLYGTSHWRTARARSESSSLLRARR